MFVTHGIPSFFELLRKCVHNFSHQIRLSSNSIITACLASSVFITNYRPISVISKTFETVIHEQLSEYFVTNNLFSPQQYGFRKKSSTELAALELLDRLLIQLDSRKIPINFYIDLSKAFDSLRHDILLQKLSYYGITNKAKLLLESYLKNRKQFVQIGDVISTMKQVLTGAPRVPLLVHFFLIYSLMTL